MKKSLSLLLLFLSFSSFGIDETATPVASSSLDLADNDGSFNPRKSHWLINFNFEGLNYHTDYEFQGARKKFEPKDDFLIGARMGFGGELYLGAGFMTSTRVEGYYDAKLFKRDLKADPNVPDVVFSEDKITSQLIGGDIVQSLSFLFDMKTKNPLFDQWSYLTVEPFIEAGLGMGWAYNRRNYRYQTGVVDEVYRKRTTEDLTNLRFGAGIHFTSRSGYFFTMRVTQNNYDVTKKSVKGFQRLTGGSEVDLGNANPSKNLDPIMVYSLGGGVKF